MKTNVKIKQFMIIIAIIGAMVIIALGASGNISLFVGSNHEHSSYAVTSGGHTACPDHAGWTAITADGGTLAAGNYVLSDNVPLTTNLTIPSGIVNICLNGHKLTGVNTSSVITVNSGAELNLYDCNGNGVITGGSSTNGGGVYNEGTFTMNGGTISNNTAASGGGVYNEGTFTMNGGAISRNKPTATTSGVGGGVYSIGTNANFTMNDGTISGNTATASGGGVSNKSNFTMSGGTISGNKAIYGGGVDNAGTNAKFTMSGGTIGGAAAAGNTATASGGGVYNEGTFTMSDTAAIPGNTAKTSGGGVYNAGTSATFTMSGGTISGNTATDSGGGVYNTGTSATFTMSGGIIGGAAAAGNKATNGGGVYNKGPFTMSGGTISGNTATDSGGGVYNTSSGTNFTMSGTATISGNTATGKYGYGGGVYSDGNFTMRGGTISGNAATISGGGVYNTGISATFTMSGGIIGGAAAAGNKATYGGGVYNSGTMNVSGSATVTGNTLADGTTWNNVYLPQGKKITVKGDFSATGGGTITYAQIGVTLATGYGSGAFTSEYGERNSGVDPSKIFTADSSFGTFVAFNGSDVVLSPVHTCTHGGVELSFANPIPFFGGTLTAGNYVLISDVPLTTNLTISAGIVNICLNGHKLTGVNTSSVITVSSGAELNLYDCQDSGVITGGSAENGGGVYNAGTFTMSGGTISGNTAMTGDGPKGGGVYNAGTFTMTGGTISGNTAKMTKTDYGNQGGYGGGVYNAGSFTTSGGTISGNTAENSGGGVYNTGTFTMSGGTISGNTATDGGGVSNYKGAFTTSGTATISGNTATDGGGVYNTGTSANFTMRGGTISDNTAKNSGGGVYNGSDTTFTMSGGTISDNTVESSGGGVYNNDGTFTTSGGTISGNTTIKSGGGVYNSGFNSKFTMSGTVAISGNTLADGTTKNNVYLLKGKKITVTGALYATGSTTYAQVGVTLASDYGSGAFTAKYGTNNSGVEPSKIFTADNDSAAAALSGSEVVLSPVHTCTHGGNQINFGKTITAGGGELSAGNYVLNDNVTLTTNLTIPSGIVNICLNGRTLTGASGLVITVNEGATLNLYDCQGGGTITGTGRIFTLEGALTIESGTYTSSGKSVIYSSSASATLIINGGTLKSTAAGEAALYIWSGLTAHINGGSLIGDYAIEIGNSGTVYLSGAPVLNGTTADIEFMYPGEIITPISAQNIDKSAPYTGDVVTILAEKAGITVVTDLKDNADKFAYVDNAEGYRLISTADGTGLQVAQREYYYNYVVTKDNSGFTVTDVNKEGGASNTIASGIAFSKVISTINADAAVGAKELSVMPQINIQFGDGNTAITQSVSFEIPEGNAYNYLISGKAAYTGSNVAIIHRGTGTLTIKADISSGGWAISNKVSGIVEIIGGKITSSVNTTVYNEGSGTIILRGGTVQYTGSNTNNYGISNSGFGSKIELYGGTVISDHTYAVSVFKNVTLFGDVTLTSAAGKAQLYVGNGYSLTVDSSYTTIGKNYTLQFENPANGYPVVGTTDMAHFAVMNEGYEFAADTAKNQLNLILSRTYYYNYIIYNDGTDFVIIDTDPTGVGAATEIYRGNGMNNSNDSILGSIIGTDRKKADGKYNDCTITFGRDGELFNLGTIIFRCDKGKFILKGRVTGAGSSTINVLNDSEVTIDADVDNSTFGSAIFISSDSAANVTIIGGKISAVKKNAVEHSGTGLLTVSEGVGKTTILTSTIAGGGGVSGAGTVYINASESGDRTKQMFLMTGGTIENNVGVAVLKKGNCAITVTGGTIYGKISAIYVWQFGQVTISGGDLSSTSEQETDAVVNVGKDSLTISGGTITQKGIGYSVWYFGLESGNDEFTISGSVNITGTLFVRYKAVIGGEYTGDKQILIDFSKYSISDNKAIVVGITDLTKWKLVTAGWSLYADSASNSLKAKSSVTVTFNMGEVLDNTAVSVDIGKTLTKPTDPAADGLIFAGWYTVGDFKTLFDFDSPINAETTLYAKWTVAPFTISLGGDITVTYNGLTHHLIPDFTKHNLLTYAYQWYVNGVEVSDAEFAYKNVTIGSTYRCVVTATFGAESATAEHSVTVIVTPAVLTVTAEDQTIVYNKDIDGTKYIISGFVGADNIDNVKIDGNPTLSANALTVLDGITIVVDFSKMSATNYTFKGVDGKLTVQKATYAAVPAHDKLTGTYDKDKTLADYPLSDNYRWLNSMTKPTVATTEYLAFYNADSDNYHDFVIKISLTIARQIITVPQIVSKTYNKTTLTADVITSKFYSVTQNNGGTNVGKYDVILTLTDAANTKWNDTDNAELTLKFDITTANVTVTIKNQRSPHRKPLVDLTADGGAWSVTDGKVYTGDNLGITLSTDADLMTVGKSAIIGTKTNDNYTVTFVSGEYEVYAVVGFDNFMKAHSETITLIPGSITLVDIAEIEAMVAAYDLLDEDSLAQFSDVQVEAIAALKSKADAILSAKSEAETALAALNGVTAEDIRTDGIDSWKTKITTAEYAVAAYTKLSSGLSNDDLDGFGNLANATTLTYNYDAALAEVNNALAALKSKTAQGILDGNYTRSEVQTLLETATAAVTIYTAAGGKTELLTDYSEVKRITSALADYDEYKVFMTAHGATVALISTEIGLSDLENIQAAYTSYDELREGTKELITQVQKENIAALKSKAAEILSAKSEANTALAELNGMTAEGIRTDGIDSWKTKILAAKDAVAAYTKLSSGLSNGDLDGFGNLANATALTDNYDTSLAEVNNALAALQSKTAQGILDGNYTRSEVQTLLETATAAVTTYTAAGGKTELLTDYSEVERITSALADYDEYKVFMTAHGKTIALISTEIGLSDLENIQAAYTSYDELREGTKELITQVQKENIAALKSKADAILSAKSEAETALAALNGVTVEDIRTDGIDSWKTKITTAEDAVAAYTKLSSGLSNDDLDGFGNLADATTLTDNYDTALAEANTALAVLKSKTAQGILDGNYTRSDVQTLLETATAAVTTYIAAGGKTELLTDYSEIERITSALADYDEYKVFMTAHGATVALISTEIGLSDLENIQAAYTSYDELREGTKELITQVQKENIAALKSKADAILSAKSEAETALETLNGVTAIKLRNGDFDISEVKLAVDKANAAVKVYTDLSSGVSTEELTGYENIAAAVKAVEDYNAYLAFLDEHGEVYTKKPGELTFAEVDSVNQMYADYTKLTNDVKAILTKEEKDNITALKEDSDELTEKKGAADKALEDLKNAIASSADKATIEDLKLDAENKVEDFFAKNGIAEDLPHYSAIEDAKDKISAYEKEEFKNQIKEDLGAIEDYTPDVVGGMDIPSLEDSIIKVQDAIDKIDASSEKAKDELADKRAELVELKDRLYNQLTLEKAKDAAIAELKTKRDEVLASSTYSANAKREIAEYYAAAIKKVTLAGSIAEITFCKDTAVAKMSSVEPIHVGWLVTDLVLALLVLGEITYLVMRKVKAKGKKNVTKTYSFLSLGLLLTVYGGGYATGIVFFVLLLITVLALGIWIVKGIFRDRKESRAKMNAEQTHTELENKSIGQIEPQQPIVIERKATVIDDESHGNAESEIVEKFGKKIFVRYNYSFQAKLIQSGAQTQRFYGQLTDELNAYGGLKSTASWRYMRYYVGRNPLVLFMFRGKTLCAALALDPEKYESTKYHGENMSKVKRFAKTPMLMRLTSPRKVLYTCEFIKEILSAHGIGQGAVENADFSLPYQSTEELIAEGLVKILSSEELNDHSTLVQADITALIRDKISLHEAQNTLTDEIAATLVEKKELVHDRIAVDTHLQGKVAQHAQSGKRGIINIDTLSENFSSGDSVTLLNLKQMGLVAENVHRLKVLARGSIDKPLTVTADEFSLDAVKMIILTGGKAIKK